MFAGVVGHLRTSNARLELQAALQPISSSQWAANGSRPAVITAVYPPGAAAVQRLSGSHLQTKCFHADISSPLLHVRFLSAYSSVAPLCSITASLLSRHSVLPHCRRNRRTDAPDCRLGWGWWGGGSPGPEQPVWPLCSSLHVLK